MKTSIIILCLLIYCNTQSGLTVESYKVNKDSFMEVDFIMPVFNRNLKVQTVRLPFTSNILIGGKYSENIMVSNCSISGDTLSYFYESTTITQQHVWDHGHGNVKVRSMSWTDPIKIRRQPLKFKMLFHGVDTLPKYISMPVLLIYKGKNQSELIDFVCEL